MEIAQIAVLIALAWMIIALVSNKVPFGAIGLGIPFILIIGGVFESPIKAMGDLAGPTTLLVASIMILAQGIFKSGLAEVIGNFALKLTGGRNSTKLVLLVIIVISAALSMFLLNTGCVTILLPVIIAISMSTGISRSQTLFVMNMAVGIGGCMTAIGTTINTAARGMIQDNGFGIIGFFDLGAAAIPAAILGTVFMLTIGYRLLPTRVKEDPALAAEESALTKELSPEESRKRRTAMIVAGISFLLVVIGVLTETLTGIQAWVWGMAGVLVLMCSRTISEKDAFAIPWGILMFVFGCSVLAAGFKTSGIAELAVGPITAILGDSPSPLVLTAVMFFVGAFFTQFMSNFGTFGIFSGVAITLATAVGANPAAMLIALAMGCNASYATPMATTANALILGEGDIRFSDWLKNGIPQILILGICSIIFLPLFFPFYKVLQPALGCTCVPPRAGTAGAATRQARIHCLGLQPFPHIKVKPQIPKAVLPPPYGDGQFVPDRELSTIRKQSVYPGLGAD